MDEFDVIDLTYDVVNAANIGLPIYKGRSELGLTSEHIVISYLNLNELDFINKVTVSVDIFVPLKDNGIADYQRMRDLKRKVRTSLSSIDKNDGQCKETKVICSAPMPELKEGFECVNIKLEILIDY